MQIDVPTSLFQRFILFTKSPTLSFLRISPPQIGDGYECSYTLPPLHQTNVRKTPIHMTMKPSQHFPYLRHLLSMLPSFLPLAYFYHIMDTLRTYLTSSDPVDSI